MNNDVIKSPLVSIRLMTFNHATFIEEAFRSIDMQETNFNFEVVVGDDFSSDDTLAKIKNFHFSNSKITVNVLNRIPGDEYDLIRKKEGRLYNFIDILNNCRGKYIALLDGDDYWTDPLKLQKQVDFMEQNSDVAFCFHQANLLMNDGSLSLHPIPEISKNGIYTYTDLLQHYNFITTASVLFRKPEDFTFPKWFSKIPFGDMALYHLISRDKKIVCLPETMAVYRLHSEGIYSKLNQEKKITDYLSFYKILFPYLTVEQQNIVSKKQKKHQSKLARLKYPNSQFLRRLYKKYLSLWLYTLS